MAAGGSLADTMKQTLTALSRRYQAALRMHLKAGLGASLCPASTLGREAVALGLKTLELARMHEQALVTLELSSGQTALIKRAKVFFYKALTPLMEPHRTAQQDRTDLNRWNDTLNRRTLELAATRRRLQRGIIQGKRREAALKRNGEHCPRLLKESLRLQEGLRQLTRKNFSAHEKERRTISHKLQDEIAQTLLAINVRLLTLKTAARGSTKNLAKEIASTQRLVEDSVESINRFARALDRRQPAQTDRVATKLRGVPAGS